MTEITREDLRQLCVSAGIAGVEVDPASLNLEELGAGDSHVPNTLPSGKCAVYIFEFNGMCLKVGKVNQKSKARYRYQHYRPHSCRSNLALSLLGDAEFTTRIGCGNAEQWIRQNTTRYNVLIPAELGDGFVHFAEAFFILKCRPRFEDG
jgi:hypothetical protein